MTKKQLSKSEIKQLNEKLKQFDYQLDKKDKVERADDGVQLLLVRDKPVFFHYQGNWFPTLKHILQSNPLKTVTVDMGAVRFVAKGADIMRPGITQYSPGIKRGEPVAVVDQAHNKPIAVGVALLSGEEINNADSGKVVRNIHRVGDQLWNY